MVKIGKEHDKIMCACTENRLLELIQDNFLSRVGSSFKYRFKIVGEPKHHTEFEFPLIKTEGNYSKAVGFIDVIYKLWDVSLGKFDFITGDTRWQDDPLYLVHHLIEIKTPKDFRDIGAIIRQIKYQKDVYLRLLKNYKRGRSFWEIYRSCVLSSVIPENAKKILASEGIVSLEIKGGGQDRLTNY